MGSSMSMISDSIDEYEYLCRKYNEVMQKPFSTHHDWLEDLNYKRTTLSYNQYNKIRQERKCKQDIKNLENEIAKKQKELNELKKSRR